MWSTLSSILNVLAKFIYQLNLHCNVILVTKVPLIKYEEEKNSNKMTEKKFIAWHVFLESTSTLSWICEFYKSPTQK